MHPALKQTDHRPWTHPSSRWTWRQNWYDLLFAHYPIPAAELRHLVPAGLNIQEFDGTSWVGVVPFRMTGVMRRPLPDLPGISAFPELNVRLYVERDGKPGVWFLSLDATNRLAIWAARRYFHLPYWHSNIKFEHASSGFQYHSKRTGREPRAAFEATYYPVSDVYRSSKGSLEEFLTERYCLYAQSPKGHLYRCEVHHAPWPLQKAEGKVFPDELLKPHGISTRQAAPLMHFSKGVEVVVWSPEALGLRRPERVEQVIS